MQIQEPPSRLINRELQTECPEDRRGSFPKEDTARRRIQRQRRKVVPQLPKSLSEMIITDEWQKTSSGDQFVLFDVTGDDDSNRITAFYAETSFQYLCRSKTWYGDETFSIAPQHFYQLYTVHGACHGSASTFDVFIASYPRKPRSYIVNSLKL